MLSFLILFYFAHVTCSLTDPFQSQKLQSHYVEDSDSDSHNFGFVRSQPKAKPRSGKAKATHPRSVVKKKTGKIQRSRSPRGSPKDKASFSEKEIQSKTEEVEATLAKLEQINPKTLWNRTLTEKEMGSRLKVATTLLSELGQIESLESVTFGGLKNRLEQQVRAVESHKSMVSQLLLWKCNLEEPFLLSTAFAQFFKELDQPTQQTVLIHIGNKLLEAKI